MYLEGCFRCWAAAFPVVSWRLVAERRGVGHGAHHLEKPLKRRLVAPRVGWQEPEIRVLLALKGAVKSSHVALWAVGWAVMARGR